VDGQLACADAHSLAALLSLTPGQFAQAIADSTDYRFYRCQLGLFGYGLKSAGLSKIVLPAKHVPAEIQADIDAIARDGGISCSDVWAIAERHAYPRLGLSNIVEAMGLKVRPCQLGCF
jgi:hypothetical protein